MNLREYLIGVTAAAILCALVKAFFTGKGFVGSAVKLLLGLLMTLAVVRPWVSISLDGMFDWSNSLSNQTQSIVNEAEKDAANALHQRIKEQAESYILEKAQSFGAQLEVEVTLSDDSLPIPVAAVISGAVSPYARQMISQMLTQELGIDKEAQKWIG